MKTFILTICILLSAINIYSQEIIYAEVSGDTATIHHDNVERNCCALYRADYDIEDSYTINIFEVDTGDVCYCMCYFNLSLTINRLPAGYYTANIYHVSLEEDTTFCGNTTFEIIYGLLNPLKLSDYQSECFNLTDIKKDKNEVIDIYPNPFSDYFKINIGKFQSAKITVYDISGKEIINTVIPDDCTIHTKGLKQGLYLYKIISGKNIYFGKFIKY